MATVEDVARDALAQLDSEAGRVLASRYVDQRYKQLAAKVRLRHLRVVKNTTLAAKTKLLTLPAEARHLTNILFPRLHRQLRLVPLAFLDRIDPGRIRGDPPLAWAEVNTGLTDDNQEARVIEVYPASDQAETLTLVYYRHPLTLGRQDPLPPGIDAHTLREGVLVDLMRWEMAKALRQGQVEVAATWRNEYRAQETTWQRAIMEAAKAERGADDLTAILEMPTIGLAEFDVLTAEDHIRRS